MSVAAVQTTLAWQIGLVVVAYALGCLNTGYYLVRLKTGRDIRTIGSGNAGARNVGRVLGRSGFVITLMGDLLKGAVAVLLAKLMQGTALTIGLTSFAVVAGHLWPIQLGFRGGKGAASGCGAILALDPVSTAILLIACGLLRVISGRSSLSAVVSFGLCPGVAYVLGRPVFVIAGCAGVALLVIFSHVANLKAEGTPPGGSAPDSIIRNNPSLPAGKR